jgi:hypothetical protein
MSETVMAVPPLLVMVSDRLWLLPVVTLPKLNEVGLAEIAPADVPVPERAMLKAVCEVSVVTLNVPVDVPVVVGAKVTFTDTFWPGASESGRDNAETAYPLPLVVTLERFTEDVPALVMLAARVALPPTVTFEKLRLEGESEISSVVSPVPVSCTEADESVALLFRLRVEVTDPALLGVKLI